MAFINDDTGHAEFFRPTFPTATGPTRTVTPTAPVTPPAPPVGDITIGQGSTPEYGALISGDPGLLAVRNSNQQQTAAAAAQRREALRRLAIQYGGLPSGFADQYGDLDQSTLDMASKNAYSQKANIQRNYDQGIEGFKRALAARGVLQSGELGHGLDQADIARGQQEYDAGNQFADQYQAAVNGYTGVENQARQSEASAIGAAAQNVYANPANRPVGATTAHLVEGSSDQYGFPVYLDPNTGKRYKIDGSEFFVPQTTNATTPTPMNADGTSAPVAQLPYTPGPTDANGVPISAGFYGFDSNGNWIG
jgi:hypothetical protein